MLSDVYFAGRHACGVATIEAANTRYGASAHGPAENASKFWI